MSRKYTVDEIQKMRMAINVEHYANTMMLDSFFTGFDDPLEMDHLINQAEDKLRTYLSMEIEPSDLCKIASVALDNRIKRIKEKNNG